MKWPTQDWQARLRSRQWATASDCATLRELLRGRSLWLASASPRRREILTQCGVRFRALEHALEEPPPHGPDWREWVRVWARRKAVDAASGMRNGIVIAADTIVVLGSRGLGKPEDLKQARAMLRALSGCTHRVFTGVAAFNLRSRTTSAGSAMSRVRFRALTERDITKYLQSGESRDKAGAYAIQGEGGQFVDKIDGPLDNIIGLPVGCLNTVLKRVLA